MLVAIMAEKLLTVRDAAERLRLTQHRVRKLCQQYAWLGKRVGPFQDRWAILESALTRFQALKRGPGRPAGKKATRKPGA